VKIKPWLLFLTIAAPVLLASCGSSTAPTTYTIGGNISGLTGTGLVLQYNSGNNLTVNSSGPFIFANAITSGSMYTVTILTQPSNPAQTCTVISGGSGTANSDIVIVQIACENNTFTVGGTVSGLAGSALVLQDNGAGNLTINSNGAFTFSSPAQKGSNYLVTVLTQPTGPAQTCNVSNGVGNNISGNVTAVQVTCYNTTVTFTIGGTVSGLSGTGLVLQDNSGDNLSVSANGSFTFATPLASGSNYSVTVLTEPTNPSQTCAVAGGGGTATANVTSVALTCGDPIAAGFAHACAITGAGGVACWGANESGQLGNGTTSDSAKPVPVTGLGGVVSVAAGSDFTCALTDGGAVWCWGNNSSGQLGNDTYAPSSVPVRVLDSLAGAPLGSVTAITAGRNQTCAVTASGSALCWGNNSEGQLGNGTFIDADLPTAVAGLSNGVTAISAGSYFTCAVNTAGAALCWGHGPWGQLGNGTDADSAVPSVVLAATGKTPLTGVAAISAGAEDACALMSGGPVLCWGANNSGQLGNTAAGLQSNTPVAVSDVAGDSGLTGVVSVSAGTENSCAVTAAGAALCWGQNGAGAPGSGAANAAALLFMPSLSSGVTAIAAGEQQTCALTSGRTAVCWGFGPDGQLNPAVSATYSIP
jgi:alpha-tubulin suppressor-like RCC1 family protein